MSEEYVLTDEQREIIDTLAEMIIPADNTDDGLAGVGFAGIMETRNKYQPWMAFLYDVGIKGLQQCSHAFFGKTFLELDGKGRARVLDAVTAGKAPGDAWTWDVTPIDFFINLKNDACFVYCTQEEVWEHIGFGGASFEKGGYPDFADPQD
jgi:Gluconate 2-dehydrogenase subunit 3